MKKVLLVTTTPNHVPAEWYVGYKAARNVRSDKSATFHTFHLVGAGVARLRDQAVRYALENGYDQLIFIDADVNPSSKQVRALSASKHAVVSAAVPLRDAKSIYLAGDWLQGEDGPVAGFEGPSLTKDDKGEQKVARVAAGMLKVDAEVFQKLAAPYFHEAAVNNKAISEDYTFCMACGEAGIGIYCDCDLVVEHSDKPITATVEELKAWAADEVRGPGKIPYARMILRGPGDALQSALAWLNNLDTDYKTMEQIAAVCGKVEEKVKSAAQTFQKLQQKHGNKIDAPEVQAFLSEEYELPITDKVALSRDEIKAAGGISRAKYEILLKHIITVN